MLQTATTTPRALLTQVSDDRTATKWNTAKISIIGCGTIGTAIGFTLVAQQMCSHLVLIDENEQLARGEMLDIQQACMYLDTVKISASTDYGEATNSKICIVTAGIRGPELNKDQIFRQNIDIFKSIIPKVVNSSPNCILIICSYPVDEMSYVAWRMSGLPHHRVIGVGTLLESSRFRCLVAQKLEVHPSCCQAYVIGEQGTCSIPIWSSVSVAGVRLRDVNPELGTPKDPEDWSAIHVEVVLAGREVTRLKDCGSWGLALNLARVVRAILENTAECFALSTHIKGCRHGVEKDIYMSLPCIIGSAGVKFTVRQHLSEEEKDQLQKCADTMFDRQRQYGFDERNKTETMDCLSLMEGNPS